MDIAGYVASVFIGIALGLIGGGGSILTVPVLVYLFGIAPPVATVYSLFVVGSTGFVGSLSYLKKKWVSLRTAAVFGIPSIAAVFLTRTYGVPAIPDPVFNYGHFTLGKNLLLMLLFAVLMLWASYRMIRKETAAQPAAGPDAPFNYPVVLLQGIVTGIITGLVGAGGGFLIIPVLVNVLKMPMQKAVGTSLIIITINSLAGFAFSLHQVSIHWSLLLRITAIAIIGIGIGTYLSSKIDGKKLKPAFGWFVLVMGLYIVLKEILPG